MQITHGLAELESDYPKRRAEVPAFCQVLVSHLLLDRPTVPKTAGRNPVRDPGCGGNAHSTKLIRLLAAYLRGRWEAVRATTRHCNA